MIPETTDLFYPTIQDGKLYYASKIYAAYQSLIESSPVPTPPSSVSFDDLLQGGA